MLNYRIILVTDANAADTDADHNGALCAVYTTFGDIMPTDMVVGVDVSRRRRGARPRRGI